MDKLNWLLLRGLAREVRHWGDFSEALSAQSFCRHIVALDLPGIGTEKNKGAPLSITSNCDDIRERWLRVKVSHPGPWGIIGVSLGGMIGLEWISRFPEDFKVGVLVNASARNVSPVFHRIKPKYLCSSLKAFLKSDPEKRELEFLKITSNLKFDNVDAQKMWIEIAKDNPIKISTMLGQLMAAARFKAPKKNTVPLLFISSKADRMVDCRASQKLSEIYGARLRLHDSAGHDLTLDDQQWVLAQISEFVDKPS